MELTDFDLTLESWSMVLFGSILLSHSKTINAEVVSFLNLYVKHTKQKTLQFWRVVNGLKTLKTVNKCVDIQARGPQKREAPGICPVWPMVNPALLPPVSYATDQVHLKHEQPQVLWMESNVTIGTIQQTQDAASVLWVYRHNSWHAAWPTVILRLMETRWKSLSLSTRKLNKTKFREYLLRQIFDEV